MKKLICAVCALSLCAVLMAGCNGGSAPQSSESTPSSSSAQVSDESGATATPDSSSSESQSSAVPATADTEKLASIVSAIEAVNEIPNPREINETSLEFDMGISPDQIVAFDGDVTNNQDDCALVFAAQVQDGSMDAVLAALNDYKASMTTSLYADDAAKIEKAEDARIVSEGNIVVMVIAGVNGPDYADIDTAINGALA